MKLVVKKEILLESLNNTARAISTKNLIPILTGINIKITGDILECSATDSYRLARKYVEIDKDIENEVNIVIPGKNLLELTKMLDDDTASLEMHLFSNKVIFKFNNILFQSFNFLKLYPLTIGLLYID